MDLFRAYIPAQDQSIYYLGQIFGYVGNVLPVTSAPMILGAMFSVFNTIVLGVGALIILYVTVVGVVKTAHEGEFLGKQWNSIWTPLRMVLGIATLVPTPSGYSVIQIIIMWAVIQGIGAGNAIWSTVLRYQSVMGSLTAPVTIPSAAVGTQMSTLFQSLVCQETARQTDTITAGQGILAGGYYCAASNENPNRNAPFCRRSDDSSDLWNIRNGSSVVPQAWPQRQADDRVFYKYTLLYKIGPEAHCGSFSYCDPDKTCTSTQTDPLNSQLERNIRCNACKAQQQALQDTVQVFSQIGKVFAQGDVQYREFLQRPPPKENEPVPEIPAFVKAFCDANGWNEQQCCLSRGDPGSKCSIPADMTGGDYNNASPGATKLLYWPYLIKPIVTDVNFVQAAAGNYTASLSAAVQSTIMGAIGNATLDEIYQQAERTGWIMAGAYYYLLAKSNNGNVTASMPEFSAAGADPRTDPSNPLYDTRNNFDAAGKLVSQASAQSRGSFESSLPPQLEGLSKLSEGLNKSISDMMDNYNKTLSGGQQGQQATNPLIALQSFGNMLLIIAQVLFYLILLVIPPLALLGFFDVFVLGTGFNNPIGGTLQTLVIVFAPIFAIFMGVLFTYGAMLAIYVPLIPYIIFTMGAITWFILVIEAMVAGPLIALGILSPGGEHEILGKAHHALMLIFGIFLRPAMMIFGLVAAILLSVVAVTMVNAGFKGVIASIYSSPGVIEAVLFIGAYIGILLAVLNKCFALIHIIPDRVMRYIGGQPESEGAAAAQEGMAGAKEGVQTAAGSVVGGAAGGMIGKMMEAGKATKKLERKKSGAGGAPTATPVTGDEGGGGAGGGAGGAGAKGGGAPKGPGGGAPKGGGGAAPKGGGVPKKT